jgi:predicted nucleic acid-binding protein
MMKNPRVYLETSFISYLTGPLSQSIITAANQYVTREWWENRRLAFDLFISQSVIDEIRLGNPTESAKRLVMVKDITLLVSNHEVIDLALAFLQEKGVPSKANDDAYHIAVATVSQMNYLLTWNCKHIANAQIQPKLRQISLKRGFELPILCTPYELLQEN